MSKILPAKLRFEAGYAVDEGGIGPGGVVFRCWIHCGLVVVPSFDLAGIRPSCWASVAWP